MNRKNLYGMVVALITAMASTGTAGDLTVTVSNFKNTGGMARIWLWNKADGFPTNEKKAVETKVVLIGGSSVTVAFQGLAPGTYAVTAMHDEDGDGKMGKNLLGIPVEGYAVSSKVPHSMGVPKFEKSSFLVDQANRRMEIKMRY